MQVVICPNCSTRVARTSDCACPSCRQAINDATVAQQQKQISLSINSVAAAKSTGKVPESKHLSEHRHVERRDWGAVGLEICCAVFLRRNPGCNWRCRLCRGYAIQRADWNVAQEVQGSHWPDRWSYSFSRILSARFIGYPGEAASSSKRAERPAPRQATAGCISSIIQR